MYNRFPFAPHSSCEHLATQALHKSHHQNALRCQCNPRHPPLNSFLSFMLEPQCNPRHPPLNSIQSFMVEPTSLIPNYSTCNSIISAPVAAWQLRTEPRQQGLCQPHSCLATFLCQQHIIMARPQHNLLLLLCCTCLQGRSGGC
jgi:hypothetical protein